MFLEQKKPRRLEVFIELETDLTTQDLKEQIRHAFQIAADHSSVLNTTRVIQIQTNAIRAEKEKSK